MSNTLSIGSLRPALAQLARENVYIGTSSWKYPGWRGQVYDEERYFTRGKWSEAKFERECLVEYSDSFQSVCVDAGYYKFPNAKYLAGLCSQVPAGFKFGIKVTDTITIKHYTNLPRFGNLAGKPNQFFLDPILFQNEFLAPWKGFKDKLGVLIFEFSHFHASDFAHGREFMEKLDHFFSSIPKDWPYAVEVRNKSLLNPEYFAMLRSHGVAHVFNSWTRMPDVAEQIALESSITTDFTVARFLLKPGRTYEDAVNFFSPYDVIKEQHPIARDAAVDLIKKARKISLRPSFLYFNNRLEGNAPSTITLVVGAIDDIQIAEPQVPPPAPTATASGDGQQLLL